MRVLFLLILIPFALTGQALTLADSDVKAFYTANGGGKGATGGRGQTVVFVTNTNDSGAGSLRTAVSGSNRIIVFRVGGTITLSSRLTISGSNITIAGETAPGDGIALYGQTVYITGSNVVMRHIRIRAGDSSEVNDALRIVSSSSITDIMLDHLSISWGRDENFSIFTGTSGSISASDITIQRSIMSESFNSKNVLLYGQNITNISFIENYFANTSERAIRCSTTPNVSVEFYNNYAYHYFVGMRMTAQNDADIAGNVWEDGPDTQFSQTIKWSDCSADNCPPSGETSLTGTEAYVTDNLYNGGAATLGQDTGDITLYLTGSPKLSNGYTPYSSQYTKNAVLSVAGARNGISGLDASDLHMIADANDGTTGAYVSAESQTNIGGGAPTLSSGTAYVDSDGDGLSDEYEIANGGSETGISPTTRPAVATLVNGTVIDQSGVTSYASAGYTHMDFFLGELAGDWTGGSGGSGGTTTPNALKNATSAMLIAH